MKKNKTFRTTAIFRCIVTLASGAHRIIRLSIDKVAIFNAAMRQFRDFGMLTERYATFLNELQLAASDIISCRVINERTSRELLTI